MRCHLLIKIAPILGATLFGLAACTILGGSSGDSTPTPRPTSSIIGMHVVSTQACKVAEQDMIRVENPQGDLIAWSPTSDSLAYIASTQDTVWNVGELNILTAPKFDSPIRLATQAAGELAWSPDASSIAYLGLRRSDNLYTIGLAYPAGQASKDLFPGDSARTDDYSGEKAILEWMDTNRLRVLVSCGINCLQTLDVNVISGHTSLVGDQLEKFHGQWDAHVTHPSTIPPEFSKLEGQLNWSWDDQHIAYIDGAGNAWVVNVKTNTLYPLEIGQYGTATETDWSSDNRYLAVQVDNKLMVFTFQCP